MNSYLKHIAFLDVMMLKCTHVPTLVEFLSRMTFNDEVVLATFSKILIMAMTVAGDLMIRSLFCTVAFLRSSKNTGIVKVFKFCHKKEKRFSC